MKEGRGVCVCVEGEWGKREGGREGGDGGKDMNIFVHAGHSTDLEINEMCLQLKELSHEEKETR